MEEKAETKLPKKGVITNFWEEGNELDQIYEKGLEYAMVSEP